MPTPLPPFIPGTVYTVTIRTSVHTGRTVTRKLRFEETIYGGGKAVHRFYPASGRGLRVAVHPHEIVAAVAA